MLISCGLNVVLTQVDINKQVGFRMFIAPQCLSAETHGINRLKIFPAIMRTRIREYPRLSVNPLDRSHFPSGVACYPGVARRMNIAHTHLLSDMEYGRNFDVLAPGAPGHFVLVFKRPVTLRVLWRCKVLEPGAQFINASIYFSCRQNIATIEDALHRKHPTTVVTPLQVILRAHQLNFVSVFVEIPYTQTINHLGHAKNSAAPARNEHRLIWVYLDRPKAV
ncbi:hypothetical protein AXW89_31520 [Pseudomonas aeruginosa]|nr:hypothetical protein A9513_018810 [Pseudomonas sp. AU12215]RIY64138.1 hypothetical protein AXW89_31520 [Pseudomonas aeruginosa]